MKLNETIKRDVHFISKLIASLTDTLIITFARVGKGKSRDDFKEAFLRDAEARLEQIQKDKQ